MASPVRVIYMHEDRDSFSCSCDVHAWGDSFSCSCGVHVFISIYIYIYVYMYIYICKCVWCGPCMFLRGNWLGHLGTRRVDPSDVKIYGHIGHRNIEHAVIQGHMDMHACRDIWTYDHIQRHTAGTYTIYGDTITGGAINAFCSPALPTVARIPNPNPSDRLLGDLRGGRAARPNKRPCRGGPHKLRPQFWPRSPHCGWLVHRCVSVHLGRIRKIVNPFYIILTYIYILYTHWMIPEQPLPHWLQGCRN